MAGLRLYNSSLRARARPLKELLIRTLLAGSVYLFVLLVVFAFLALFSFRNLNTSDAFTRERRAAYGRPRAASPSSPTIPISKPVSPYRNSSSSSSPLIPNRKSASSPVLPGPPPRYTPTFVITCGSGITDAVEEMQPLLKSILMLISQPVHIVFLTDAKGGKRIRRLFRYLAWTKKKVWVDIYVLNELLVDTWAAKVRLSPWAHHSGRWGTAKLILPWIIRDRDRAVLVDTDMIFMQDPMNLWELFNTGSQDWIYQMPVAHMWSPVHICSCIVLFKLDKIREQRVYPKLMKYVLPTHKGWYDPNSKLYKPNCGDQGVYWLLMKHYPKLFQRLPVHWARGRCGKYQDALKIQSTSPVGILHRNCGGTNSSAVNDEASPFFDFWSHYRWHWLQPSHGVKFPVKLRSFGVRRAHIGL